MSTKNQFNDTKETPSINIKALSVVFVDMDGTLLDTLPGLYKVYMTFLKDHHEKGNLAEFNDLNGRNLTEIIHILKNRYLLKSNASELEAYYRELCLDFYRKQPPIFPQALETLQYLKSIGLKLYLVTSASKELASKILANPSLKDLFSGAITGDRVVKGKPDPEIFQLALAECHISPQQAIVIEDAPHGVAAAQNANIYVVQHHPKMTPKQKFHEGWVEVKSWELIHHLFRFLYE